MELRNEASLMVLEPPEMGRSIFSDTRAIRKQVRISERANFRVDFAWGKDEDAYYVSLREAF